MNKQRIIIGSEVNTDEGRAVVCGYNGSLVDVMLYPIGEEEPEPVERRYTLAELNAKWGERYSIYDVTDYFTLNNAEVDFYDEDDEEVARGYKALWDTINIDPEGPTAEQDKELDDIIFRCYQELNK